MRNYQPACPFNVPMYLLVPVTRYVKGVLTKTYLEPKEKDIFYGSFRSFGGTELTTDGVHTVQDTATVETWYRPDIKANCRIIVPDNNSKVYEIIGTPENINMRSQFLKFKVQAVGGGS